MSLPAVKTGKWTATATVEGPRGLSKRVSLGRAAVVRGVLPGAVRIRLSGPGNAIAAIPGEVTWQATRAASLRVTARPVRAEGTFIRGVESLPPGTTPKVELEPLGGGPAIRIVDPRTTVPAGNYRINASAITVGDTTHLSLLDRGVVTIEPGGQAEATVNYATTVDGSVLHGPDISIVNTQGNPDFPDEVTLADTVPVNSKVLLPATEALPGGFVGIVTEVLPDGRVVAERRPLLSVIPNFSIDYTVSRLEIQEALRKYARANARDASCSATLLYETLTRTSPVSWTGKLATSGFPPKVREGEASVLFAAPGVVAQKASSLVGECSLPLPYFETTIPGPIPLFLYIEVSVGARLTLTGADAVSVSPTANLNVGVAYSELAGWRPIFEPRPDLGASTYPPGFSYDLKVPSVTGEIGLSPIPRSVSGLADVAIGATVTTGPGVKGPVPGPDGATCWAQIYAGYTASAFAKASLGPFEAPLTWNIANGEAALGDPYLCGDAPVSPPPNADGTVKALSAGNGFLSALSASGQVLVWVDQRDIDCPNYDADGRCAPMTPPVDVISGVDAIATGHAHVLALKGGRVIAWGDNSAGQTEVPPGAQSGVSAVFAFGTTSVAIKGQRLVVWGTPIKNMPKAVQQGGVTSIDCGVDHCVAVINGGVRQWYIVDSCNNPKAPSFKATCVPPPPPGTDRGVTEAHALHFATAVVRDGRAISWGAFEFQRYAEYVSFPGPIGGIFPGGGIFVTALPARAVTLVYAPPGDWAEPIRRELSAIPDAAAQDVIDVAQTGNGAVALRATGSNGGKLVTWGQVSSNFNIPDEFLYPQ